MTIIKAHDECKCHDDGMVHIIACDHHDIVQQNFNKGKYVCTRCGVKGTLDEVYAKRCQPHYESATSGFTCMNCKHYYAGGEWHVCQNR